MTKSKKIGIPLSLTLFKTFSIPYNEFPMEFTFPPPISVIYVYNN